MSDKVSIIIPAYNQGQLTIECIKGVLNTCGVDFEIVLVDDGSTELMYQIIPKLFPGIRVIRSAINQGFVKSTNTGIRAATGNLVLMLNNDVKILDPMWLKCLLDGFNKRELDFASVAGGRFDAKYNYVPGEATKETDKYSYLVGWCLLARKDAIEQLGCLDERFGLGYFDDADLSFRARAAGFKLGIVEGVKISHLYHQTFKALGGLHERYVKNRRIFLEAHGLAAD